MFTNITYKETVNLRYTNKVIIEPHLVTTAALLHWYEEVLIQSGPGDISQLVLT